MLLEQVEPHRFVPAQARPFVLLGEFIAKQLQLCVQLAIGLVIALAHLVHGLCFFLAHVGLRWWLCSLSSAAYHRQAGILFVQLREGPPGG
nr:hypothetical protein BGP89_11300 [Luteimonas sp. JM171]